MLFTQNDAAHSLFDVVALGGVASGGVDIASPLAQHIGLDQRSCSMSGTVSTGMGDRSQVYRLGI